MKSQVEVLANIYTNIYTKQTVYKQLALEWQTAKQLSGINSLSLSNNKNLQIKEKWNFFFVKNVK